MVGLSRGGDEKEKMIRRSVLVLVCVLYGCGKEKKGKKIMSTITVF
jgi:hypothetical protein